MILLKKSSKYQKEYQKFVRNNPARGEALIKALNKLSSYPTYPSLRLEKLGGSEIWSARIDLGNRIFFIWINKNVILLIDIGSHDKYKEY